MSKELYRQENPVIRDAFDRLAVAIHLKNRQFGYKTFMLCGSEPGSGTTTIAIELAISMASAGWKTVLIDCDMRKESSFKRLSEESENGLFEYLLGENDKGNLISKTNHENLYYVSNGAGGEGQVNLLCSPKFQKLLKELRTEYDYVILDVPSFTSSVDSNILAVQVDAVVLIAAQHYSEISAIRLAREKFVGAGANVLGVVVNKTDEHSYKKAISDYDYFVKKKYKKEVRLRNGGKDK